MNQEELDNLLKKIKKEDKEKIKLWHILLLGFSLCSLGLILESLIKLYLIYSAIYFFKQ